MLSQLQIFILPANVKSDGMMSHKHTLAAKTVSKWHSLNSLLLRQISLASRIVECLLAMGEDKKGKLFGVTSFNNRKFRKEIANQWFLHPVEFQPNFTQTSQNTPSKR